jgi:predicted kinase
MNWFKRQKKAQSKIMYIMRGLPGSGKSTKAKNLAGDNGIVLSTDDFFTIDGKYKYDPAMIGEAHFWNEMRAQEAIRNNISPIVIDNTSVEAWESKKYVQMGTKTGYDIRIEEADTDWAFNPEELSKRNTHEVPQGNIERMLEKWHPDLTVDDILSSERPTQSSESNKMQKFASVTFYPSGGEKVAQPKTTLNIATELVSFSHKSGILPEGARLYMDDVDPDGDDWNESTGILNFYLMTKKFKDGEWVSLDASSRIRPSHVVEIIKMWNENNPGIQMNAMTVDESRVRGVPTVRIEVLSNDTEGIEEIPQMSIANENASQLLNMLSTFGVEVAPTDEAGSFSADVYKRVRQSITTEAMQDFTRPGEDGFEMMLQDLENEPQEDEFQESLGPYEQIEREQEQSQGGPSIHSFGLDASRINAYLTELDEMVMWLDKNGVPDRMIIFG